MHKFISWQSKHYLLLVLLQCRSGVQLVRKEGFLSLWKGVGPAMTRGVLYGGLRLGLYGPIKSRLSSSHIPLVQASTTSAQTPAANNNNNSDSGAQPSLSFRGKVLAGTISGAIAATLTSPLELVKVRRYKLPAKKQDGLLPLHFAVAYVGWW